MWFLALNYYLFENVSPTNVLTNNKSNTQNEDIKKSIAIQSLVGKAITGCKFF